MPIEYVNVDEAIARSGLRMVVVGGIPSPWGEAAKGMLHIKRIPWCAVRLSYDSEPMKQWTGQRSGPVAIYNDDKPRSGWAEILLLAERLAPEPALLLADAAERALAFGLAHEICGEGGLGWTRRLQLVHAGLQGSGGFAPRAAQYLSRKYGYSPEAGAAAPQRVAALLRMLSARLHLQRAAGSGYYIGDRVTAVDVYSATFTAMFRPSSVRWTRRRGRPSSCAIRSPRQRSIRSCWRTGIACTPSTSSCRCRCELSPPP